MGIKVNLPASLRRLAGGATSIQADGGSIAELFADIDRQAPGFRDRLCDESGRIRKFVAVFVNGRDIRTLQGSETPLTGTEEVTIVTAIAGG